MWGILRIILLFANAVLFAWLGYIVAADPEPATDPQFVLACGVLIVLALNFFYVLLANRPLNWRVFRSGLWTIRQASQGCGLHVWFPPQHVAAVDRAARSSKRHAGRAGLGWTLGSHPADGNAGAVQAFVGDERHDCGGRKSKCRLRQLESLCQSQSGLRRRALDAAHHAGLERSGSRSLLRAVS